MSKLIEQFDKYKDEIKMIGREAIATAILNKTPIGADNLLNLFNTLSVEEQNNFLQLIGKQTVQPEETARPKPNITGYSICADLVRKMNGELVTARIEGRWEAVVEHDYHAHYTRAYLRRMGAIPHYLGEGVDQEDPQIYS